MIWALLLSIGVSTGRAAEVSAAATCVGADTGDILSIVSACKVAEIPLADTSWAIEVDAANLPLHDGGTFSRFAIYRENEVYELTTAAYPSIAELRQRKFKSINDTEACSHRRRFTLSKAAVARLPKVNVQESLKKATH